MGGRGSASASSRSGGASSGGGGGGGGSGTTSAGAGIEGKSFSSMSNKEKLTAAAIMFGTGSKQYQAAVKKYR